MLMWLLPWIPKFSSRMCVFFTPACVRYCDVQWSRAAGELASLVTMAVGILIRLIRVCAGSVWRKHRTRFGPCAVASCTGPSSAGLVMGGQ